MLDPSSPRYATTRCRDPRAVPSPLLCKPAPAFSGKGLSDATATLRPKAKGYKLVNFWASWCATCKVEHPHLLRLSTQPPVRDFQMVGVLFQDKPADALRTEKQEGKVSPTLVDEDALVSLKYGVVGTPESFLINPKGLVIRKYTGPLTYPTVAMDINLDKQGALCPQVGQ